MSDISNHGAARAVLAADGFGCIAAAVGVLASRRVGACLNLADSGRRRLALALLGTGAMVLWGARRTQPTRADLERSAGANLVWVLVCVASRCRARRGVGRILVTVTAALDGVCGSIQWWLSRGRHDDG